MHIKVSYKVLRSRVSYKLFINIYVKPISHVADRSASFFTNGILLRATNLDSHLCLNFSW